ncbi:hypothetical protein C8R47DRAFT_1226209 [Mycena vitilis]|nr:hypothetical protein C8R47DRAFT_1226209 [Mycena vitilis]
MSASAAGDSPDFPLTVDDDGRVRINFPSLIRQDIPRRRPETSIRAARVDASTSALPRHPRHKPMRIIRRPLNGARTPQYPPLTREHLWLTAHRPPVMLQALHEEDLCRLCLSVKSHPVWSECGHSHCYACIRVWLEDSWKCPQSGCDGIMYRPPVRNAVEEEKLAVLYPKREDKSVVNYSWSGLIFPRRPGTPSP